MISADTVLNIISENNLELLKNVLPDTSYELIKRKYEISHLPYLKTIVKKQEQKQKVVNEIKNKEEELETNDKLRLRLLNRVKTIL